MKRGLSRRSFLNAGLGAGVASALRGAPVPGFRLGCMDIVLRMTGKPEAFALAGKLGFEGVQVSLVSTPKQETLALSDPEALARCLVASRESGVPVAGTTLSAPYTRFDEASLKWVRDALPIVRALKTDIMLVAFFGVRVIADSAERDRVAELLKEVAPEAEKAGVILGVENTISAEDNARILDRAGSDAVRIYYDVGNSTNIGGFDAGKEIRWLGRNRICQFHLKDKGYLGEGKVNFPDVLSAIREIGYRGFAQLETSSPSGSIEEDMRRNLDYLRRLLRDL